MQRRRSLITKANILLNYTKKNTYVYAIKCAKCYAFYFYSDFNRISYGRHFLKYLKGVHNIKRLQSLYRIFKVYESFLRLST